MKLKRILFSLLTALLFTITSSQLISASTISEKPINQPINLSNQVDYDNLQIQETDGSIISFDNLSDMKKYVKAFEQTKKSNESIIQPLVFGQTVVGTQYRYFQFMGYSKYTKDWQKNSQYTITKGQSQTFSNKITTNWGDVTISYSHSEGVTRTIPADAKRWSRLAGYADLKIQRIKTTQPSFGTIYTTKTTKLNLYTDVKYK